MGLVDPAKIRNVAVVGHRGAGKTSFVEALLYSAGAKNRLGTITDGTTTMDYDEDADNVVTFDVDVAMGNIIFKEKK